MHRVVRQPRTYMTLEAHDQIDLISLDKSGETVVLSRVATRPWGDRGELLPELQAKLNTYLTYALDGQLLEHYPQVRGKRIRFRLHYLFEPGPREEELLRIVRERYLGPEGIEWEQSRLQDPDAGAAV
jgi:hypothetical protein